VIKSYRFLSAVLFCMAAIPVQAANAADRQYPLADQGTLQLSVPTSWRDQIEKDSEQLLASIVFVPTSGAPFGIVLNPIWPAKKDSPRPDSGALKRLVQRAADEIKPQTVEQTIEIVEVEAASGTGYYFSVTDRSPSPQYKYLTQGVLPVGLFAVAFTIYTNDGQQEVVNETLTMLKSATISGGKAD